jgi:hypothetical protein
MKFVMPLIGREVAPLYGSDRVLALKVILYVHLKAVDSFGQP